MQELCVIVTVDKQTVNSLHPGFEVTLTGNDFPFDYKNVYLKRVPQDGKF
jgi:hypothetical protein